MAPSAASGGGSAVAGAFRRRANSRRGEWAWIEQQEGKDREGKDGNEDCLDETRRGSARLRGRTKRVTHTRAPWTGGTWLSLDEMRRRRALASHGRESTGFPWTGCADTKSTGFPWTGSAGFPLADC